MTSATSCLPPLQRLKGERVEFIRFGISFNVYMFHGGTNFGFMNGATSFEKHRGVTTSYGKCSLGGAALSLGPCGLTGGPSSTAGFLTLILR